MEIKLIQDVQPGEYIRHNGQWVQVEMLEPGIMKWWVYYDDAVFLVAHNTRVAVVQPLPEADTIQIVWPTRAELPE